jgi:hypothetical protein
VDRVDALAQRQILVVHQGVDERLDEPLLAPKVVGDECPVLSGLLLDRLQRQLRVPLLGEDAPGGVENAHGRRRARDILTS